MNQLSPIIWFWLGKNWPHQFSHILEAPKPPRELGLKCGLPCATQPRIRMSMLDAIRSITHQGGGSTPLTVVGQTHFGQTQLPSLHVYQEECVLIFQIWDNVFKGSIIPNPFENAIWTTPLSSSVSLKNFNDPMASETLSFQQSIAPFVQVVTGSSQIWGPCKNHLGRTTTWSIFGSELKVNCSHVLTLSIFIVQMQ